jgi:methionyl-tRNA synthetase
VHRYRDGRVPAAGPNRTVAAVCAAVPRQVDAALADFDFRRACAAVWTIVDEANRYVDRTRPWQLARAPDRADELDVALATLVAACRVLGDELAPLLPGTAAKVVGQCTPVDGRLPAPHPVAPRLDRDAGG